MTFALHKLPDGQTANVKLAPGAHRERTRRLRHLIALGLLAAGLSACSQEVEHTPEQRSCIAQRYSSYDPKQLNQCVDVCKLCMRGNTVTCNTSCRLRGAS